jgi:hypothetical protein
MWTKFRLSGFASKKTLMFNKSVKRKDCLLG